MCMTDQTPIPCFTLWYHQHATGSVFDLWYVSSNPISRSVTQEVFPLSEKARNKCLCITHLSGHQYAEMVEFQLTSLDTSRSSWEENAGKKQTVSYNDSNWSKRLTHRLYSFCYVYMTDKQKILEKNLAILGIFHTTISLEM